jgi:hypothetical protein
LDKSKHTKKVKSALKNYQPVWLLYETEPGPGVIPVPDDLEPSEVAEVQKRVEKFVNMKSQVSHKDIVVFTRQMTSVQIREDFLDQIINGMVLDQRLEQVKSSDQVAYRAS